MTGWLEKATRVLKRGGSAVSEPPPVFELTCPCGELIRGFRRQQSQRVICKGCGEPYFILARNAYPPVASAVEGGSRRSQKNPPGAVSTVVVEDDEGAGSGTAARSPRKPSAETRKATVRRPDKLSLEQAERVPRRFFRPLRIALAATVLLLGVTGYSLIRNRQMAQAERTFREQHDKGISALRDGEFATAAGHLAEAERALEVLGRDDLAARQTRQMHRETRAVAGLMSMSLLDLILEGEQAVREQRLSEWQDGVKRRFGGTWLVAQTVVSGEVDSQGRRGFSLQTPIVVGETAIRFHAVGELRPEFVASADATERIVAVQFESCRLEESPRRSWSIGVSASSAFLWTDYGTLTAIGFGPDELHTEQQLRDLLAQQARIAGVAE